MLDRIQRIWKNTFFISEQTSHHPPLSAFAVLNSQEKITLSSMVSFAVRFGGNSVSIVTDGAAVINCEKLNEQYQLPKRVPDMVVRNLILGTKKVYWEGDIKISCSQTGFSSSLKFSKSGQDNIVKGTISNEKQNCINIEGKAGQVIHFWSTNSKDKKILVDFATLSKTKINYLPENEISEFASTVVWADFNKYIVADNMEKADEAKQKVEVNQRQRIAEMTQNGTINTAKYFKKTDTGWVLKDSEDEITLPKSVPTESKVIEEETNEEESKHPNDILNKD